MLSFPSIPVQHHDWTCDLVLPSPEVEFIRLLIAFDESDQAIEQRLRDNPALLIFCAACFYEESGNPVASVPDLRLWCQRHLFERIDCNSNSWSSVGQSVSTACLNHFIRARTACDLRKSLVAFMTAAVDWRRKFAKRWIRTIFAEEFVVCDHEFISRRQQKQRRRSMLETWHHPCAGPTNVAALYSQRKLLLETRREFDAKLLQQKMAAMKQLAYGASHEINNPLANIATRAQTLLSDEQNPERQHKLAVIYEQALRAHEMISDLMLFANPPAIQCVNTDLRLWLATIIKEVAPLLEKMVTKGLKIERHRIEIEVRLGPDVRQLNVDPIHLGVALKLLLKNSVEAIRAADRAGKIELRVFRDHDYQINFSVTDDGVGVSERVEPHLFDPFYSSREAGRGLGFGLSKAWRIAELHGGALRFDAQYSPGARFVLQIPQGACAHAFVQKIESIAKPVETPCPASELFEASA